MTKLLVQPGAGTSSIIDAIDSAKEIIQIVVFRFDRMDIEAALRRATKRGVFVHALVAHTSVGQGGDTSLRRLEVRLLADGMSVARSASDLLRYHSKLILIDRKLMFLLAFNYTHLDIVRSRSFGIVTDKPEWIAEAVKLFDADTLRQPYECECDTFIVSPNNSRRRLMDLLGSAQKSISIYDDKLSDIYAMRMLALKVREGVNVRVIGSAGKRAAGVRVAPLYMRLHGQVIICDNKRMFMGSQSLRSTELDARREVGVIIDDPGIIGQAAATFESDWAKVDDVSIDRQDFSLDPIADVAGIVMLDVSPLYSAETIKSAVKEAIKDAVLESCMTDTNMQPLKKVISSAAKEALLELAE